MKRKKKRADADQAEQAKRPVAGAAEDFEAGVLAGFQIDVEVLPEQRIVRLETVGAGGNFAGDGPAVHQCADVVAIEADDDLAVADVVGVDSLDCDLGWFYAHDFSLATGGVSERERLWYHRPECAR